MEWEPIETAPKDGTIILLARHDDPHKLRAAPAYWWPAPKAYKHKFCDDKHPWCVMDETNGLNGWTDDVEHGGPTHWRHIPRFGE